ncbi:MAG: hypothetical protein HOO96_30500 [Polyangiaceae bacterium]|nr:hypothetical protein [Polyangiaceae bacterium]
MAELREVEEADGLPPYRVCAACAARLTEHVLRPLEWFRLAALHGWSRYHLHDDFYDELGRSIDPVDDAELHPFPALADCAASLPLAVDVAYALWHLPRALVPLFAAQPAATLELLEQTTAQRPHPDIRASADEIAAVALGPVAEEWIRRECAGDNDALLFPLAQAAAACLPRDEALAYVRQALAAPGTNVAERIGCLAWFHDEAALDLIEQHACAPISETWGRTAAASGITWDRARRWMEAGRPLSTVALDALHACVRYDSPLLAELAPRLLDPPDVATLRAVLTEQMDRDPVPRVKKLAARLIEDAEALVVGVPDFPLGERRSDEWPQAETPRDETE